MGISQSLSFRKISSLELLFIERFWQFQKFVVAHKGMEYGWEAAVIKNYLFLLLKQKNILSGRAMAGNTRMGFHGNQISSTKPSKSRWAVTREGKVQICSWTLFSILLQTPSSPWRDPWLPDFVGVTPFLGFRWIRRAQLQMTNYQTGNSGFFFPQLFPFPFQLTE